MGRFLLVVSLPLLLLTSASCGATEKQLRSRAAFDMKCPEPQIQIVKIDRRTRGVRACGQQATYVETCASQGGDCTWVLNTDSRESTGSR